MKETVSIILPLPKPILSPNKPIYSRGGRIGKAVCAKKYRELAKERILENETTGWKQATLEVTFFHKQKRKRDSLNFMSMLKSAIDGIIDAGLLPDDDHEHLTPMPPAFKIDKECPRVEIILRRSK